MKTYKLKFKLWIAYYAINDYYMLSNVKDSVISIQIKYENL